MDNKTDIFRQMLMGNQPALQEEEVPQTVQQFDPELAPSTTQERANSLRQMLQENATVENVADPTRPPIPDTSMVTEVAQEPAVIRDYPQDEAIVGLTPPRAEVTESYVISDYDSSINKLVEDAYGSLNERQFGEPKPLQEESLRGFATRIGQQMTGQILGEQAELDMQFNEAEQRDAEISNRAAYLQSVLDGDNKVRKDLAKTLIDSGKFDLDQVTTMLSVADFSPVIGGILYAGDIPEEYDEFRRLVDEEEYLAAAGVGALNAVGIGASFLGAVGLAKGAGALVNRVPPDVIETARKYNYGGAQVAEFEEAERMRQAAAAAAAQNRDIASDFIRAFEDRVGRKVSKEVDGQLEIDPVLAREAGKQALEDAQAIQTNSVRQVLTGEADPKAAIFPHLTAGKDPIVQPILVPEKFDAIVAAAADLKKQYPDAFDNKKTVIDNLFELTVNKELIGGQELIDTLGKYGLSFEDYVLTVVGSGSEAGRVLNKLSQLRRVGPRSTDNELAAKRAMEVESGIRQTVMRIENIRRGGMVSQIATAARNLTSAAVRAPAEGLANVMDTAMYRMSSEGILRGAGELVSSENWKNSFAHMKYMFDRPDVARGYTDYILNRPELKDQYELMFESINEIHRLTGRGKGGGLDTTLTALEDGVDALNIPNRWQEYLIRRGAFLGELERLTKREWDTDLFEQLNAGKIKDLLNDVSTVKPEGARSFNELVADSVKRAMDITYAKQPEIQAFRSTATFITRNGLTVAIPFPRFMFNSMELMGQYAAGASIPLTRKMASLVSPSAKGPLTAKDRERISRNIVGMATVGGAIAYRSMEDAPAEFNMINSGDGTVMDTTPQFPVPQFLYMGEATKRLRDGTFSEWFDAKTFVETFTGSNFRTGTSNALLDEMAEFATGTDLSTDESLGRALGRTVGSYLSSWAVPFAQLIEAERVAGVRGLEYKDVAQDPTLDFSTTFMSELTRPIKSRGLGFTPAEEAQLPARQSPFTSSTERVQPALRFFGGFNLRTKDAEYGEYLKKLGYDAYEIGSQSKVPTIRRYENELLRDFLPVIVDSVSGIEQRARSEYRKKSEEYKDRFTEDQHVNAQIKPIIESQVGKVKQRISEGSIGQADPYTRAVMEYRKLAKPMRKWATSKFFDMYNRDPVGTDTNDLRVLSELGKAYTKATR